MITRDCDGKSMPLVEVQAHQGEKNANYRIPTLEPHIRLEATQNQDSHTIAGPTKATMTSYD